MDMQNCGDFSPHLQNCGDFSAQFHFCLFLDGIVWIAPMPNSSPLLACARILKAFPPLVRDEFLSVTLVFDSAMRQESSMVSDSICRKHVFSRDLEVFW